MIPDNQSQKNESIADEENDQYDISYMNVIVLNRLVIHSSNSYTHTYT